MPRLRQSASHRLEQLPELFSVDEFQQQQKLSAKAASVYLARWQAQSLIGRLGPRCGLWVNLTKAPAVTWEHRRDALLRKHPLAVVGGSAALAAGGWLSEASDGLSVVIPHGSSKAQFDGVVLLPRSTRCHALLAGWAQPGGPGQWGLPTLPPEAAAADLALAGAALPASVQFRAVEFRPWQDQLRARPTS